MTAPTERGTSRFDAVLTRLRTPVDAASLAAFRIMFGLVVLVEVYRYFSNGWIDRYWVVPEFHFTYPGFGWVHPMPADDMHVLWGILGLAALGITLGWWYRVSCTVFAIGFGYCFLLEATRYLNHFYLITLLAVLLAIVPAHRVWSVDAWTRRRSAGSSVPAWSLWLLRFQVAVVYVYGGLAKLEPDWLRGEPMTTWLGNQDSALLGSLLARDGAGVAAAWAGLVFDLFIVLGVAWRRTRVVALVAAAAFHLANNQLFDIGVFPYLAFAALLLFCDPSWPRTTWDRLVGRAPTAAPAAGAPPAPLRPRLRVLAPLALVVAGIFVAAQLLIPLRHLPEPGRSNWTEVGHTFSWHMKLRTKEGDAVFRVVDPGRPGEIVVDPLEVLPAWQYRKMATRPELIRQFAHYLADRYAAAGVSGARVYAVTEVSLNGRPKQRLVDPDVDLAAEDASLSTPSWIVPLRHPLPRSSGQPSG